MPNGHDRTVVCPFRCVSRDSTLQRFPDIRSLRSHLVTTSIHKEELVVRGLYEDLRKSKASELSELLARVLPSSPIHDASSVRDTGPATPSKVISNLVNYQVSPGRGIVDAGGSHVSEHRYQVSQTQTTTGQSERLLHRITPAFSGQLFQDNRMSDLSVQSSYHRSPAPRSHNNDVHDRGIAPADLSYPSNTSIATTTGIGNGLPQPDMITSVAAAWPDSETMMVGVEDRPVARNETITTSSLPHSYPHNQYYPRTRRAFAGGNGLSAPPNFSSHPPQPLIDPHQHGYQNINPAMSSGTLRDTQNTINEPISEPLRGQLYWQRGPRRITRSYVVNSTSTGPNHSYPSCLRQFGMNCNCLLCCS